MTNNELRKELTTVRPLSRISMPVEDVLNLLDDSDALVVAQSSACHHATRADSAELKVAALEKTIASLVALERALS